MYKDSVNPMLVSLFYDPKISTISDMSTVPNLGGWKLEEKVGKGKSECII